MKLSRKSATKLVSCKDFSVPVLGPKCGPWILETSQKKMSRRIRKESMIRMEFRLRCVTLVLFIGKHDIMAVSKREQVS